ncbi:MAG TPA: substrate-binding domain-containing protein [Candidatus Sulfomarinibacteraceae bacterium]|nr:substrate-binding domain-containing protein [Candidatus Sulfomarinibacteraceae bacterium]
MVKKFTLLLILISALALLAACQTTPEEVPDTTNNDTSAEVETAQEEEVAEESAAAEEPAAQEGGQWCAGTDIVFFPGGPPGGPFATVVYNGALQAEADLGANVEYIWSDWNPEQMVTQLGEAIATNPDGIAIMGHPGDDAYGPLVEEAVEQGIIVTSQNTTLPELEARYASEGFGYVGAELYDAGYSLGAEAVSRFDLQEGERAMVWGLLAQAGRGQRTQGVIDALEEAGMEVDYLEIDDATNAEAAAGIPTFVGYVSANPDVRLVVTDHGALTATLESYLTSADLGPDDIYAAGFDLSPATVDAIRGGWTDLVIDQQQWLQGYLPILQICLTNNYLFTGLHINTGAGFAHADNIDMLADLVQQQIR